MADALKDLAKALLPELSAQIGREFGVGFKHDASGTPIATGYSHGPGGSLTFPGVDPLVFHTIVGNRGIVGQLPTNPSVFTDPTFQTLTGVQDKSGSNKEDYCDDAPTAGLLKGCIVTAPFGRYELATPELELNRLGQRNDRADPMDLRMVGSPIYQAGPFASGPRSPATPADLLQNEISRKFWELNLAFHRLLSQQMWVASSANNSGGGGYREFNGFQRLINTGYVDAITGVACPALDSDLKDFAYQKIPAAATTLVTLLSYLYMTRRDLAFRTGLTPVRWVLAMRPELFWEITAIWPCSYLTHMCQVTGNQQVQINAADQIRMRDEMRAGSYLLINGDRIEVVVDDGITVHTPTTNANVDEGCMSSDIYFVPMSVAGGQSVTFMQHADYANPSLAAALGGGNLVLAKAEGAFLTWPRQTNQCIVWQSKIEPRIILRTPWLAGRIQNVQWCPEQVARQPFPADPYHVDGGQTTRPGPSFYTQWP